MKKYVKFTEGKCSYLTPDHPYKLIIHQIRTIDVVWIESEKEGAVGIMSPDSRIKKCAHLSGGHWKWCDEKGKEIL
jgi:hypothetical protein